MSIRNGCGNSLPPFWCVLSISFPLQMRSCTYAQEAWSRKTFVTFIGRTWKPWTVAGQSKEVTKRSASTKFTPRPMPCMAIQILCWLTISFQAYAMVSALDLPAHSMQTLQPALLVQPIHAWLSQPLARETISCSCSASVNVPCSCTWGQLWHAY